jgi:fructose-bisphosphate aldolase/2-amino-3,7-dideoxy-D-threo-hept-6-ulosonate synthase
MVKNSVDVGGAGVAIGRNVFQAKSPLKTTKAISEIVHNKLEVEEALKIINGD